MGQLHHLFQVEESLAGVGRHFAVKEPCILINQLCPLIDIIGIDHFAPFDVALLVLANGKLLEGPAVNLAGSHKVDRVVRIFGIYDQQRLGGSGNGGHPGGGGHAGGLLFGAIAIEQGQYPFHVIRARVGNAGIAPGGDFITQRRLHFVRIPVGLGGGHIHWLDDRPLVEIERFLHRVDTVNGNGIETALAHSVYIFLMPGSRTAGRIDVVLFS